MKKLNFTYAGIDFNFFDDTPFAIEAVAQEIMNKEYPLESYLFDEGDVVIDIGSHVGIISIILAKLNPELTIYAFEPLPSNFSMLLKNIEENNISNIKPFQMAVTEVSGRQVYLYDRTEELKNSGGASLFTPNPHRTLVDTISLDDIFKRHHIKECNLLKIDCEGSEYDILLNSNKFQSGAVKQLLGEFHTNEYLSSKEYTMEKLLAFCNQHVPGEVKVKFCTI